MKTYRDLQVWQKAVRLVTEIYRVTREFPNDEVYCLTSQIRRSAISVPSNIAEGYGRRSTSDYLRFLQISMGSLYELQTQLTIAQNLGFITDDAAQVVYESSREIERMLSALINRISMRRGDKEQTHRGTEGRRGVG